MSKGLTPGAAWLLAIVFSAGIFTGILILINTIEPGQSKHHNPEIRAAMEQKAEPSTDSTVIKSDEEAKEIKADSDEGAEIRADDYSEIDAKKKARGHTKATMVPATGLA